MQSGDAEGIGAARASEAVASLVADAAQRFLVAAPDRIDEEVVGTLEKLAGLVGADAATFAAVSDDGSTIARTHVWHAAAASPPALPTQSPAQLVEPVIRELARGGVLLVTQSSAAPDLGGVRELLESLGTRGFAVLPVRAAGQVVGAIELLWRLQAPAVSPEDLARCEVLADLLATVMRGKRAVAASRAREARLERITEAIPGVVYQYRLTPDGQQAFTFVSSGANEAFGLTAEALTKDAAAGWARVLPEDVPDLLESIARSAATQTNWIHEFRLRKPDDTVIWLRGCSTPEPAQEDGATVWNGLFVDVTERKRLEDQLALAARMSSMGTMAAGVAHEINNPLAYLSGNLSYALAALPKLREGGGSPTDWDELTAALEEAVEGSHRVRDIVADLKAFSRVAPAQRSPVDLHHVLDVALRMTRNELRHRARLVEERGACPPVMADESKLAEVIVNLIVNAVQAMPEADIDRNVVRVVTRLEGSFAVLEVHDNGVGIPPANLQKIFEPFFTTKPIGQGTGLGLAVCHRIVSELGGRLTVESVPGEGSAFRVHVPIATPPATAEVQPSPRARLLVVDDDPMVLGAVARVLSRDHEVATAASGAAALAHLAAHPEVDLVLCDLMMPGISGAEVYARACEASRSLTDRFVFMTGGAFTPAAEAFRQQVRDRVVDKPLDSARIRQFVGAALARLAR